MNDLLISSYIKDKLITLKNNTLKKQYKHHTKKNIFSYFNSNKNNRRHAFIYFQNIGHNTFITVRLGNKLIYNKSLGELKIGNTLIKKKEKRFVRNIYTFGDKFANFFFNKLAKKYKIRNASLFYNVFSRNIYPLTKQFKYRWFGFILKARKRLRKYLRFRYKKPVKKRRYLYYRLRKKITRRLYYTYKLYELFRNRVIFIKPMRNVRKYPYNGCKNRKMKI